MWKAKMYTGVGLGVKKVGLSSPDLSTQRGRSEVTGSMNLPQTRKLLTYPLLSTRNLSFFGKTYTPSSTLWIRGGNVCAMADFMHHYPQTLRVRCVVQNFYRGFPRVVNGGGKQFRAGGCGFFDENTRLITGVTVFRVA